MRVFGIKLPGSLLELSSRVATAIAFNNVMCDAQGVRRMLFRRLQRMVAGRAFHAKPLFLGALQEVAEAAQKLQVSMPRISHNHCCGTR